MADFTNVAIANVYVDSSNFSVYPVGGPSWINLDAGSNNAILANMLTAAAANNSKVTFQTNTNGIYRAYLANSSLSEEAQGPAELK